MTEQAVAAVQADIIQMLNDVCDQFEKPSTQARVRKLLRDPLSDLEKTWNSARELGEPAKSPPADEPPDKEALTDALGKVVKHVNDLRENPQLAHLLPNPLWKEWKQARSAHFKWEFALRELADTPKMEGKQKEDWQKLLSYTAGERDATFARLSRAMFGELTKEEEHKQAVEPLAEALKEVSHAAGYSLTAQEPSRSRRQFRSHPARQQKKPPQSKLANQQAVDMWESQEVAAKAHNSLEGELRRRRNKWDRLYSDLATACTIAKVVDEGQLFETNERPARAELGTALGDVLEKHADVLQGNKLFEKLEHTHKLKERLQTTVQSILADVWEDRIQGEPAWQEWWAYVEKETSAAVARYAHELTRQLSKERDRLSQQERREDEQTDKAVNALEKLSHIAAGYSLRSTEDLPIPTADALTIETAPHKRYPGYGPHGGAIREPADGALIQQAINEGAERVVKALEPWQQTGMEQQLRKDLPDQLSAFLTEWENRPADLMQGLGEAQDLLSSALEQNRPTDLAEWVGQARRGALWYFNMADHAYKLAEEADKLAKKPREIKQGSPDPYSPENIQSLIDFGSSLNEHASHLARTLPPGNNPDAKPFATPHDARLAREELRGLLVEWAGFELQDNKWVQVTVPHRSAAVDELINAMRAQMPFSLGEKKAESATPREYGRLPASGENKADFETRGGDTVEYDGRDDGSQHDRWGAYDYDQNGASYDVIKIAMAAQAVLDENRTTDKERDLLRRAVDLATNNASRLHQAPVSSSIVPEKPTVRQVAANAAALAPQSPRPAEIAETAEERYPGYGPHEGAIREPADGALIQQAINEGAERVVKAFEPWQQTGMVEQFGKDLAEQLRKDLKLKDHEDLEVPDQLSEFLAEWENRPVDLMQGFGEAQFGLYSALVQNRPEDLSKWVNQANQGAHWYFDMANRAYRLVEGAHKLAEKPRYIDEGSPDPYSPENIELLHEIGKALEEHGSRLSRTLPPGNKPDADPYATQGDALLAHHELVGLLFAWQKDSSMGQQMMSLQDKPEPVAELINAINAQMQFSIDRNIASGSNEFDQYSEFDQYGASYAALRVAKAAREVLDWNSAGEALPGALPYSSEEVRALATAHFPEEEKAMLRQAVALGTESATRLNMAPISLSVLPREPSLYDPARVPQPPKTKHEKAGAERKLKRDQGRANREQREAKRKQDEAVRALRGGRQKEVDTQSGTGQPNPTRSQRQSDTWRPPGPVTVRRAALQQQVPRDQPLPPGRKQTQRQQPPRLIHGYGPYRGGARNKAEWRETLARIEKASLAIDKLIDQWGVTDKRQELEQAKNEDLKKLKAACDNRPSADRQLGLREAAERYGQIALRANNLADQLRHDAMASRRTIPISQKDIDSVKNLYSLADASFNHAALLARTVHAVRLARTVPEEKFLNARAYETVRGRKAGETEMDKRWAAFKNTDWGEWLLNPNQGANHRDPLVQQLVDAWDRRSPVPHDDWTAADRMIDVGKAANLVLEKYSSPEFEAQYPNIRECNEKLRSLAEGAPQFAVRLAQGDSFPKSLIPEDPVASRAKKWGQSQSQSQSSAQHTPGARQRQAPAAPKTAHGPGPGPAPGPAQQGRPRFAARR
ncbi:hypothetical protein ACTWQF_35650 [Streptomyces sp. 8N114]|uniref:hypothetical protein n=1 Tax=Streptomyces sp. 8N114 TaxID=3457419 RepID=UPI003FD17343